MPPHDHGEKNPSNQADKTRPADLATDTTKGALRAQPPLEEKGAHEKRRDETAGGFYAIYETGRFGLREMGLARSFHTLRKLNQKDGFDCPSCAWPDPDRDRKFAEFCENGAKAVASEATTKRLTPAVFAQHSIPEMLLRPDGRFEELGRITHPMIRR